jgi:hypothetical protein
MRIMRKSPGDGRGRVPKYDWKLWTDGAIRLAERGIDYTISDASFANVVRNYARRHGLLVTTWGQKTGVVFKFAEQLTDKAAATIAAQMDARVAEQNGSPMITQNDKREQVLRTLDGRDGDYNVDGIVTVIQDIYGTVDIDTVPSQFYWTVVADHDFSGIGDAE